MTPNLDLAGALLLINPRPEQKDACAAKITPRIELLRGVHRDLKALPSPGNQKIELEGIGRDLERIRIALGQYSESTTDLIFGKDAVKKKVFLAELDALIDSAKLYRDAVVVRHGRQPWDNIKAVTAKFAFELLTTFSAKKPTKTAIKDGGAFLGLARLLYEGVTGMKNADLGRYCRDVRDHAGDVRIEPELVVQMTFEH
jgi:hypothetical protein